MPYSLICPNNKSQSQVILTSPDSNASFAQLFAIQSSQGVLSKKSHLLMITQGKPLERSPRFGPVLDSETALKQCCLLDTTPLQAKG